MTEPTPEEALELHDLALDFERRGVPLPPELAAARRVLDEDPACQAELALVKRLTRTFLRDLPRTALDELDALAEEPEGEPLE